MPRVATTSSARPRQLPSGGRMPPSPALRFRCPEQGCLWSYSRRSDLNRHLPTHMSPEEREKQMYQCPEVGCTKKFLQKSNMITHYTASHTGLKPYICTQCSYCTADPACLHRHMRDIHAYVPGSEPRRKQSAASALLSSIMEPVVRCVSPSSESESWNMSTPSSPNAKLYYPHDALYLDLPSPSSSSSCDSSLPASPEDSWMWDPSFEAALACFDVIEPAPALAPLTHYPAEGTTVFDAATLFLNTPCGDVDAPFFPLPPADCTYDLAPAYAYSYPLDPLDLGFTFTGVLDGFTSTLPVFDGEWTEVQV
ncbi:hypothetical protein B0H16DRAFT_1692021 [Mycena metata]|uniref:C2H2-type domain-containing protein n=1 Tax=Mycena metata TaxID=1033252 RepID=A0AAD7HKG0_9AGAR|nr:hypothetical protein B0H16DRAFT_1896263 [Mycena metata]KAJ7748951.1 hypothetical protein B0H16DRAFT_1692021 [Mycena metata]